MEEYQKIAHKGIAIRDKDKGFFLAYNKDGSIDLCYSDKTSPAWKKKIEAKKKANAKAAVERREKRKLEYRKKKVLAQAQELGLSVKE